MAYGLYSHIQSNRRRSIVLLIGLFLLVYLMTFAGALVAEVVFGGDARLDFLINAALRRTLYSLPWVTIGTLLWILIAYRFHQAMIDTITGGQEVTRQDEPRLYNLLENLCISRGVTMPKLKVMESDALNAFATGLNEKQYSITVTTGLVSRLDDAEIEAVLGHELTHIRNGDVRMLVVAVIIAGVISFFAELVFRLLFQGGFNGVDHLEHALLVRGRESAGNVSLAEGFSQSTIGGTHAASRARRQFLGAGKNTREIEVLIHHGVIHIRGSMVQELPAQVDLPVIHGLLLYHMIQATEELR